MSIELRPESWTSAELKKHYRDTKARLNGVILRKSAALVPAQDCGISNSLLQIPMAKEIIPNLPDEQKHLFDFTTFEGRIAYIEGKYNRAKRIYQRIWIPSDVIVFIARSVTKSESHLDRAFSRVVDFVLCSSREISIEDARICIHELIEGKGRATPPIDMIQTVVASHFGLTKLEMMAKRRTINITLPRQIAMYLAKTMSAMSYPEISRKFGGMDHTTSLHAARKIQKMIQTNERMEADVTAIKAKIQALM